jgi:hypothetical protein
MLCVVCKMFQFIMLTQLCLHETCMFVNKPDNLPAYTSPKYLERGNYCIQHQYIQHQNLTSKVARHIPAQISDVPSWDAETILKKI